MGKTVVLNRLGVLSVAKLEAIIMVIMGFIIGLFYALFSSMLSEVDASQMPFGVELGWIAIIVLPILYGILGFVGGAVSAWIYNLIAKWIGGIEIELSK